MTFHPATVKRTLLPDDFESMAMLSAVEVPSTSLQLAAGSMEQTMITSANAANDRHSFCHRAANNRVNLNTFWKMFATIPAVWGKRPRQLWPLRAKDGDSLCSLYQTFAISISLWSRWARHPAARDGTTSARRHTNVSRRFHNNYHVITVIILSLPSPDLWLHPFIEGPGPAYIPTLP